MSTAADQPADQSADLSRAPQVRPIRYTAAYHAWRAPLSALGARILVDAGAWHLYRLGGGLLALHDLPVDDPDAGTTELGLVVADLAGYADGVTATTAAQPNLERVTTQAGPAVRLRAADGMVLDVMAGSAGQVDGTDPDDTADRGAGPTVWVCPLWMTPDVPGAVAALTGLGLVPRLASDAGQWSDLIAPAGGLVAVHADCGDPAVSTVLSFETDDADALAARFAEQGSRADIVDESYGRSLRFDDPDGGVELWVNETMTDLYGYRRG